MLDQNTSESSYNQAIASIELTRRHQIRPLPQIYEVLLAHLDANDDALCHEVETALARPPAGKEEALRRIHAEFLAHSSLQEDLERIRDGLSSEISEVNNRLTDGIHGSQLMADELRKTLREMAGVVTREELQLLCKHLAISNRTHLSGTQQVSANMAQTQAQLDRMQRELELLREQASKDHLTGLPNRHYLDEKLTTLMAGDGDLCLAIIDLDRFKSVNDTWGHSFGDNVLRGMAQVLKQNTKGKDFAARVGGEEFVVVLPNTPLSGAVSVCNGIREAFGAVLWVSQSTGKEIGHFSLSCGVTMRRAGDDADSLYQRADQFLYAAKNAGRNCVQHGP
ncbi:MAG: GGDEF domain-containing protein [Pseudomonadota bacterium]